MNSRSTLYSFIFTVLLCFVFVNNNLSHEILLATEGIQNNSTSALADRLDGIRSELEKSSYTDIIGIVVPIVVALALLWTQQYMEKRDRIRRSCEAILREIREIKDSLLSEQEKRIRYHIANLSGSPDSLKKTVEYRNIYLNTDAFESVLYSGLFTQFSVDTQHNLSKLYNRIKSHNNIITQLQHLYDNFLLSSPSMERYEKAKTPYEESLTEWEREITSLAYISMMNIESEQRKKLWCMLRRG